MGFTELQRCRGMDWQGLVGRCWEGAQRQLARKMVEGESHDVVLCSAYSVLSVTQKVRAGEGRFHAGTEKITAGN